MSRVMVQKNTLPEHTGMEEAEIGMFGIGGVPGTYREAPQLNKYPKNRLGKTRRYPSRKGQANQLSSGAKIPKKTTTSMPGRVRQEERCNSEQGGRGWTWSGF